MTTYSKPRIDGRSLVLGLAAVTLAAAGLSGIQIPTASPPWAARSAHSKVQAASSATSDKAVETYKNSPIYFTPNVGQLPEGVQYSARGLGYSFALGSHGVSYTFANPAADGKVGSIGSTAAQVVTVDFAGANPSPALHGAHALKTKVNYLLGNSAESYKTDVPTFAQVSYSALYPGIDLTYKGSAQKIKYEFTVAPGADYRAIAMAYSGVRSLRIDKAGDLVLALPGGELKDEKPVAYQMIGAEKVPVPARFVLNGSTVSFALGRHDPAVPVVIDPGLDYSTLMGCSLADETRAIATRTDSLGRVFVVGTSYDPQGYSPFPTFNALYPGFQGGSCDVFVTALDASGQTAYFSTYLGGTGSDEGFGIDIDAAGNIYVAGSTTSAGGTFPIVSANQSQFNQGVAGPYTDGFVTKLNSSGSSIVYSTYLGGGSDDVANAVAVDASGSTLYIVGGTSSDAPDPFPTLHARQSTFQGAVDAFVTVFNSSGTPTYSTYLGATGCDVALAVAVDSAGLGHVTGFSECVSGSTFPVKSGAYQTQYKGVDDVFVSTIDPALSGGPSLKYSTLLGGGDTDEGCGIAVDTASPPNVYVTGFTRATSGVQFPTTSGAYQQANQGADDAFVAKFDATSQNLLYSTFLGGSQIDRGMAIDLDPSDDAYVTGYTSSANFPRVILTALQWTHVGLEDVFMTKLRLDNTLGQSALKYGTFLGSNSNDRGLGILYAGSRVHVAGWTEEASHPFPLRNAWYSTRLGKDGFVTKFGTLGGRRLDPGYTVAARVEVGRNITVPLGNGAGVRFEEVTQAGDVSLFVKNPEGLPPVNYEFVDGTCVGISTTASYVGTAYVTLPYDPTGVTGSTSRLKMLHRGATWQDVTTGVDADNNMVTGATSSFSDFVLAESSAVSTPASSVLSLVAAAILGIAAIRRQRHVRAD